MSGRRRFFPGSKITLIGLSIVLIVLEGLASFSSPRFLAYADKPVKSDAVVLFVGGDFAARKKEALRLLDEACAQFLIVPAFHQGLVQGNISLHPAASGNTDPFNLRPYPDFYEDTHVESSMPKTRRMPWG